MAYTLRLPVRFGDIDHAGIVYYPRFFHFFHIAFEEFFQAEVGITYPDLLNKERVGFPSVHIEVDFRSPLAYGDQMEITLSILKVGRSSLTARYDLRKAGHAEPSATATVVTACVDMRTFKSMEIPAQMRPLLERHVGVK